MEAALKQTLVDYYSTFDPGGEQLRGAWSGADTLVFIDRERPLNEQWHAPRPEPSGVYSFYVQTTQTVLNVAVNGNTAWSGECPPGSIQFARPGDLLQADGRGRIRSLQASFSTRHIAIDFADLFPGNGTMELRPLRHYSDVALAQVAVWHETALDSGLDGSEILLQLMRQSMVNRIVAAHATRPLDHRLMREVLVPAKVRRVIDYIHAHLDSGLSLTELAGLAGTSRAHFSRAFRNTVGQSPHSFIIAARLMRALDMLRNSYLPIHAIAKLSGFHDHAHLTRAFGSKLGITPSGVRARG